MRFVVKDMDIANRDTVIVIINENDAKDLDLHHMDRVIIKKNRKEVTAAINIGESEKAAPPGHLGLFEEALAALDVVEGDKVSLKFASKPITVSYIHKKMSGKSLSKNEMSSIISDISANKLTKIELTSFVVSLYVKGLSDSEVLYMTKALADSGESISFKQKPIVDFHCIGGVPGNRTTLIVAPILVAAGLLCPKTSSRAITSPSGTADTMEVLCNVALDAHDLKKQVLEAGGTIAWGGGVNLAPADDHMIRIENPLGINAEGQMLASIMAKKLNVGASHVLIDIPVGKKTKVDDREKAKHLGKKFRELGKKIGLKIKTIITDGSQPVGRGIGPVLEVRDCLWVLKNDERAPKDLVKSSMKMAASILEFVGKAPKRKGYSLAKRLLKTGAAYGAFVRIVEAQGGKEVQPDDLRLADHCFSAKAGKSGTIKAIDNKDITKIARLAGAPLNPSAGLELFFHVGDSVKRGQVLFKIHAESKRKLNYAIDAYKSCDVFSIG